MQALRLLLPLLLLAPTLAGASEVFTYTPVSHPTFVLQAGPATVYVDPVGTTKDFAAFPPPDLILITHAHHDHAMGAFLILEKANPKVYLHEKDAKYIASSLGDSLVTVKEGDIIETELWPLEVIWTPGHTEGGMCLYAREPHILFSGDTAFPDGYFGRFDGESGSIDALMESLRKLARLRVEVMLAGHGVPVVQGAEENIKLALRNAELYG